LVKKCFLLFAATFTSVIALSVLPPISLLSPFGWSHRFDDLQKIGSGAMGQVWRAREVATGRSVALKLLDPARSGDEQTLARLEIEGETEAPRSGPQRR
jgi:hypothetical protein